MHEKTKWLSNIPRKMQGTSLHSIELHWLQMDIRSGCMLVYYIAIDTCTCTCVWIRFCISLIAKLLYLQVALLFSLSTNHFSLMWLFVKPFQPGYWYISILYNCKQARAKISAHISGPWSWLKPVCLQCYTYLKKYCQKYFFQVGADGFLMAAILYPRLQWVKWKWNKRTTFRKRKCLFWVVLKTLWEQ